MRFSHASHVGRALEHEDRALDCSGCHTPDVAGKNMRPIDFEENCQACHSLSFDLRFDRQAMHVDPVEMRRDLLEFYAEVELREVVEDVGRLARRRPGMSPSEARRAAALAAAKAMVVRADAFLMDREKPGACAQCHAVLGQDAEDGGHRLAAVALSNAWMPKGEFLHATHGPFPCGRCHPAAAVYDASLLPEARTRPDWSQEGSGPYALLTPAELHERHGLEPSTEAGDILIPGLDRPAIVLVIDHANARIASAELREDGQGRLVGRGVVDDDPLPLLQGLAHHAARRLPEQGARRIEGREDADGGRGAPVQGREAVIGSPGGSGGVGIVRGSQIDHRFLRPLARRDECPEEAVAVGAGELLRVPLNAEAEGAVRALDGLDDAVRSARAHAHAHAGLGHPLVVKAVHRRVDVVQDRRERAALFHLEAVTAVTFRELVGPGARHIGADVVDDRSSAM